MTYRTFKRLYEPAAAHKMLLAIWSEIKPYLLAGHRFELVVRPESRNGAQNALLHSLLSEIAATKTWAGQKWDIEDWKRLLTAAWLRAKSESVAMVPAVDGHGFDVLYRRTSTLSKAECAELIDYITAWAVENEVRLSEAQPA